MACFLAIGILVLGPSDHPLEVSKHLSEASTS